MLAGPVNNAAASIVSQLGMGVRLLEILGSELAVVWDDEHESYYPLEDLRRKCPCAVCAGEPDLFGKVSRGPAPQYAPSSFELDGFDRVGHYGLALRWRDGHSYGIWTLDRLRELCPCSACQRP